MPNKLSKDSRLLAKTDDTHAAVTYPSDCASVSAATPTTDGLSRKAFSLADI
ncbi:MAG: hypothetical protein ACK506_19165 [Pirellula sp.]